MSVHSWPVMNAIRVPSGDHVPKSAGERWVPAIRSTWPVCKVTTFNTLLAPSSKIFCSGGPWIDIE